MKSPRNGHPAPSRPRVSSSSPAEHLAERIKTGRAIVGVMGLGYVGLPLVRLFASKGFHVLGFDVDTNKIRMLNSSRSYIRSVPTETISSLRRRRRFEATTDFKRLAEPDAIIICVPTPLTADGRPDLAYIKSTAKAIAERLRKGQLVVLESTTYPGTTRELLLPELERTGLHCGKDFFLAFSPEREDPGNRQFTNETIPKIVGGMDPTSGNLAQALYEKAVLRTVRVSSCEVAEAAKLLENIYRCVNIALVNEIKMCFDRMGIDVWEVIQAASTKPFGFQAFHPGPGLGGHCIPIDPFYLSWKSREYQFQTRFIELSGEINVQMPYYVVGKLEAALRARGRTLSNSKILVLGIAYKRNVDDPRESPAFKILDILHEKGSKIGYNDPFIPKFPRMRHYPNLRVPAVALSEKMLASQDAVIIVTDHSSYDYDRIVRHAPLVVDCRNATRSVKNGREKIVKA